jgi:hypothetical protein
VGRCKAAGPALEPLASNLSPPPRPNIYEATGVQPLVISHRVPFDAGVVGRRSPILIGAVVCLAYCAPAEGEGGRASAQTVRPPGVAQDQARQAADGRTRAPTIEPCRVVGRPVELPALPEASGVAVSRRTPGVLWSLNDSGEPFVVALNADGTLAGRVRVAGARVTDWEAIAVGPCPSGSCLFVADLGDNDAKRERVTIYRVAEPAPSEAATQLAEAFHATYPDGAHDAEALFVTSDGTMFVVTKGETGHIALYRFPQPPRAGSTVRLERVAVLGGRATKKDRVTDASASPDGRWIALRTRDVVTFYRSNDLTSGRRGAPVTVDVSELRERQGEGVSISGDGTVYLVSEGGGKRRPGTLSRIVCTLSGLGGSG